VILTSYHVPSLSEIPVQKDDMVIDYYHHIPTAHSQVETVICDANWWQRDPQHFTGKYLVLQKPLNDEEPKEHHEVFQLKQAYKVSGVVLMGDVQALLFKFGTGKQMKRLSIKYYKYAPEGNLLFEEDEDGYIY
jgi:hypothetical protein